MSRLKTPFTCLLFVLIVALCVVCLVTAGQGFPHVVFGRVTVDDSPIAGASIEVENLRIHSILTATTDSDGRFQVDLSSMQGGYLDGDRVKVVAEHEGASASRELTISGPNTECNITLVIGEDNPIPGLGFVGFIAVTLVLSILIASVKVRKR